MTVYNVPALLTYFETCLVYLQRDLWCYVYPYGVPQDPGMVPCICPLLDFESLFQRQLVKTIVVYPTTYKAYVTL